MITETKNVTKQSLYCMAMHGYAYIVPDILPLTALRFRILSSLQRSPSTIGLFMYISGLNLEKEEEIF